jgi:DUF1680 family protein
MFSEMPGLIYMHQGTDLYVNLYVGSHATIDFPSGEADVRNGNALPLGWRGAA